MGFLSPFLMKEKIMKFMLCILFLLMFCTPTMVIIMPVSDIPAYKKAQLGVTRIVRIDTTKMEDGTKMATIHYRDLRP